MIRLPDFNKCVEFQSLRKKMGIDGEIPPLPLVDFVKDVVKKKEITEPNTRGLELEKKLKVGVAIDIASIQGDPLLEIEGQKVAAYILRQPRGVDPIRHYNNKYRYHLCNCRTLQYMRSINREKRYVVTKRDDGFFTIYDTSGYRPRKYDKIKMDLCHNCRELLKIHGLYFKPFTLAKYFEEYGSTVPKTITRIEAVTERDIYTPTHEDIAREYKKIAEHKCQRCGVDCSSKIYLLQLHHKHGDKANNTHENLRVLCIDCHSKEPLHSQIKTHPYFLKHLKEINELREKQGITVLHSCSNT